MVIRLLAKHKIDELVGAVLRRAELDHVNRHARQHQAQPWRAPCRLRSKNPVGNRVRGTGRGCDGGGRGGNGRPPRQIATSVDDIEEAFQRKKKKELEQARMAGAGDMQVQQVVRSGEKVGRNDPCPCGSGKKHKKCCGANS